MMARYITFKRDALERVGWTAAQGALGAVTVVAADLPPWAFVPVTAAFAALKVLVARKVGDPNSASTLRD
jgi:hypothetical protein